MMNANVCLIQNEFWKANEAISVQIRNDRVFKLVVWIRIVELPELLAWASGSNYWFVWHVNNMDKIRWNLFCPGKGWRL